MLVADRKEIGTSGCRLSADLFGRRLNSPVMVGTVFTSSNLSISGREDVEFWVSSDDPDTQISSIQEGIVPWCM